MIEYIHMQKFILISLILGLAFFLYLLQTGQIDGTTFNISKLQGATEFEIRKSEENPTAKSSDIYAIVNGQEHKIFTFAGDDFKKLIKAEYALEKYQVPFDATDAITGTWIGSRYVFYIIEKENPETNKKVYQIYKTEYPTDDISKLNFYLIKSVEQSDTDNSFEVKY